MPYVKPFDRLIAETTNNEDPDKSPWVSLTRSQSFSARYEHTQGRKSYTASIITTEDTHHSVHNHLLADEAVDAVLAKWRAGVE